MKKLKLLLALLVFMPNVHPYKETTLRDLIRDPLDLKLSDLNQIVNLGLGIFMIYVLSKSLSGYSSGNIKPISPDSIKERFSSVAGAQAAKEQLQDIVDCLKNPKKYNRLGASMPRGVLLVGEPGNGKTLLAKAVAGEANCSFISVSGSGFIEMFVGVGAARVRKLFAQARRCAPCIIFIDEIDAIGGHRHGGHGGHDEHGQTLNQLLTEMDGFQTSSDKPVIILAATNRVDSLDKALRRPGRFDYCIEVPYPDVVSRQEILDVHAKNLSISPSVDLTKIARGTPGFSGADLKQLLNDAAATASKKNKDSVGIEDIEEARDKMLLGAESTTMVLSEEERKMTAFHEAGHALVTLLIPKFTDPLHKVTIIPRGRSLGITHSLPEREKYSRDKEEMVASIKVALGGRIAEEIIFDKISTGAYSDFVQATNIARNMVTYYGMSDALGTVIYSQEQGQFAYSQQTAQKIDEEVQRIIQQAYQETKALLMANRDKLDALANGLLERETMYAGEIYDLLGFKSREDHRLA